MCRCKCHSQITSYHRANIQHACSHTWFVLVGHEFLVIEVPKRRRWPLPSEERRLSRALKEPHLWVILPSDYPSWGIIYELHEKAISWFFPVPDNRKCEVDLCRSSVRNDSSFGARHLLMQSHPAAGGREQEVILLICGRISTQGVFFGREIDESCLHKSPVENGTAELSQDWSQDGHREVHHLAELVLCVCLHAYFCTTEGKQKYSLQIPSCPWSSLGSVLITYLKILYLWPQWQSCNGSVLIRPKWTWRRTL